MRSKNIRSLGRPRAFNDKIEQNTVKSLDRALTVLTTLSKNQNKTLTDLSKELRESPSTVYRILSTMALHKIVECDDRLQTWNIGPGSFQIGSSFLRRTSLVETSRPFLRNLMEETGETANLGIENNGNVLFLSQVETHAPIRAFFPPGTLSPLHASGIGKVLLTQYTLPKLEKFIKSKYTSTFGCRKHFIKYKLIYSYEKKSRIIFSLALYLECEVVSTTTCV